MTSYGSSDIRVVFNRIPEVKAKMGLTGRGLVKEALEDIKREAEANAPYKGITKATVKSTLLGGEVSLSPWWIGFIELGSVTHAKRPFLEPAARKVFARYLLKVKTMEALL